MKPLENRANYGATLAEAAKHLAANEPFHTGTLSAAIEEDANGVVNYCVRSYGVKIAKRSPFLADDEWFDVLAYNYSATTSKHANIVKRAWGLL